MYSFLSLDSIIYNLWMKTYPGSNIKEYENDLISVFGQNLNLRTTTLCNILQTIGFHLGCFFKVVLVVQRNNKNLNNYHFQSCYCSQFKYCTKLLFTNKMYTTDYTHTFLCYNSNIYYSSTEIYGRTVIDLLTKSTICTELPSNKNLIFMYSYNENLYCILSQNNSNEFYGVEILENKYVITPISKPKSIQKLHLSKELLHPVIKNKQIDIPKSTSCMCNINEKDTIKIRSLGQNEVMSNLQIILQSIGLYQLFEPIFIFLSRLKIISYDIETQITELSNTCQNLQQKRGDIVESQKLLENGSIISKLNILLIGCCTFISIKELKKKIRALIGIHIHEDNLPSCPKKKLLNAFRSSKFDLDILKIIEQQYDPEITIFEESIHFFAHLIKYARLCEYVSYILLSRLLYFVNSIKESGIFKILSRQLYKWISTHYIFAFNGANFDNILLEQELSPYLLSTFKKKIKIQVLCNGSSCVNLSYRVSKQMYTNSNNIIKVSNRKPEFLGFTNLVFRDTRKIVAKGSLNDLAKVYELPINKLSFPYAFLKNKAFLLSINVNNMFDYDDYFYDVLKFKTMTNLEKEKLKNDFVISKCHNLFEYLILYLNRDVLVLHKLMNKILDAFNELKCNIILQNKLTISSIAFTTIYIYENINKLDFQTLKLTTSKFVNQTIKNSVVGGFCCTNISDVNIDSNFIINENLVYENKLAKDVWHHTSELFNQTCQQLLSYDIRY